MGKTTTEAPEKGKAKGKQQEKKKAATDGRNRSKCARYRERATRERKKLRNMLRQCRFRVRSGVQEFTRKDGTKGERLIFRRGGKQAVSLLRERIEAGHFPAWILSPKRAKLAALGIAV